MNYKDDNELELNDKIIWNPVETTKPDDGQIILVSFREYHGLIWKEIETTIARYNFWCDEYIDLLNINNKIQEPIYWAEMPDAFKIRKEDKNE